MVTASMEAILQAGDFRNSVHVTSDLLGEGSRCWPWRICHTVNGAIRSSRMWPERRWFDSLRSSGGSVSEGWRTLGAVTMVHTVDETGRYDGLTLREALPSVVAEIVEAFDPVEVVLFGSVARGDDGPDSDLDLLVVVEEAALADRRSLMRAIRGAIRTFVPVDIVVADVAEIDRDRDSVGSAVYWPLREGVSVHRRSAARVG
jgi:uncharacterized protein